MDTFVRDELILSEGKDIQSCDNTTIHEKNRRLMEVCPYRKQGKWYHDGFLVHFFLFIRWDVE